ncbi:uncharacterized protein SPPG_08923 [Spizellomyces punctatus DAOM BR117]|uniref:Uncharacterized protein n=1 Tax=Spizellomyces punctatus (strain DAOM BR117) TaxID=645134 RepID=A0A0L0HR46_SPIPD|nr:uncharacterized protein SPPG_08923 [Spizellomyces punctatus DAOM BR117]KND03846.1 hypothetical protein SPPG_08923 [Spizellomyces punctatus DAOM BR117]|eukprot:XP_016611885.1 hypothetical protein SPPG_08923 [Spizellomyces punctatus DAOM BR117]
MTSLLPQFVTPRIRLLMGCGSHIRPGPKLHPKFHPFIFLILRRGLMFISVHHVELQVFGAGLRFIVDIPTADGADSSRPNPSYFPTAPAEQADNGMEES